MHFSNHEDITLIRMVKENPILYKQGVSEVDTREAVWQRIGDKLNKPASVCKTRWVNVRDTLRRKIRDRLRNGNVDKKSFHYKYEKELSFMIPSITQSLQSTTPRRTGYDEARYFTEDQEYEDDDMCLEIETIERCNEDKALIYKDDSSAMSDDVLATSSTEVKEFNTNDPIDVFLMSVGSTLRKFSPYYLSQAKSKIFQVISDYELQQIIDKDGVPNKQVVAETKME